MNSKSDQAPQIVTQTFEAIKLQCYQDIGKYMFTSTELKIEDHIRGALIKLRAYVLGQHNYQKYKVVVAVPKNWWEHLKQDHFPQWYVHRYPVQTKPVSREITFDHMQLFPKCDINFPPILGPVVFHSTCNDNDVHKT